MARQATRAVGSRTAPAAVLFDCLGTLVRLEPPAPRLTAELERLAGVRVAEGQAEAAFRAEISYYLEHHLEGRDAASLEGLRDRCATVLLEHLGLPESRHGAVRTAMLCSLRFAPFPDAAPALSALRARGARLVVASNWDCSLDRVLGEAGLGELLDGVVSSAVAGAAKPDPAPFRAALELAGSTPGAAVHVGDSFQNDVEGALGAGIRAVLVNRGAVRETRSRGVTVIGSLDDLARVL